MRCAGIEAADNPFDQAPRQFLAGRFTGPSISLVVRPQGTIWTGEINWKAAVYPLEAQVKGGIIEGVGGTPEKNFPFTLTKSGEKYVFGSGDFSETLSRVEFPKLDGLYSSDAVSVALIPGKDGKYAGYLKYGGQRMSHEAQIKAGDLEGTFQTESGAHAFSIANEPRGLVFKSGAFSDVIAWECSAANLGWLEKANLGNPEAQYQLGKACLEGNGIAKDTRKGREWLEKAANGGYAAAQYEIGKAGRDSKDTAVETKVDMGWLKKAAEGGFAAAQYDLALAYREGKGVDKDESLSRDWLRKSAASGYAPAQQEIEAGERAAKAAAADLEVKVLAAKQAEVAKQTELKRLAEEKIDKLRAIFTKFPSHSQWSAIAYKFDRTIYLNGDKLTIKTLLFEKRGFPRSYKFKDQDTYEASLRDLVWVGLLDKDGAMFLRMKFKTKCDMSFHDNECPIIRLLYDDIVHCGVEHGPLDWSDLAK